MELGDANEALRATDGQVERLVDELRRERPLLEGPLLACARCAAIWRKDVAEEARRRPACPLCEGPLTAVP
jgi:hypothetical protein